jgi:hypothetical protein
VGDACTLLAGWDPDQAYWLTDILTLAGPATTWVGSDTGPLGWRPGSLDAPPAGSRTISPDG